MTTEELALVEEALEHRMTALYRQHPRDFVAARNDLASEVKPEDPGGAKRIRELRKPTLAAWGLNLVSQDRPGEISQLREAGATLRRAQASAVGGDGDDDLRQAEGRRRELVRALTDAAVERAGDGQRDAIEATLEAASVDDAVGEELSAGRLTKPRPRPSGIGDLATMLNASATRPPRRGRRRTEQLRRRMEKVEAALDRHRDELRRAQERLANARAAVESAQQHVADLTDELEELERDLAEASG